MSTAVISVILIVICYFGLKSSIKRTKQGCCGGSGEVVKKVKAADTNKSHYPHVTTLQVDGMTCENCRKRVENAFNSLDGIYAVADFEKKQVTVHMKEKMAESDIKDIVKKAGYLPGRFV
ncbi:heavy metal-associated domain-containing protein [Clostridium boliviensis]|uniref:Heavy metal-associated domain-containing protein n=1 Tax=Clostridium boliviensis TaxID=318465 RepID=A0ABU4GLY6_9CLOT|nr:heavy metal-associated domain-containing protein [Clostridium boliviensis]MDW2798626.1 heavy metal-associated domain-containing protein [Clostridium boliviensis]